MPGFFVLRKLCIIVKDVVLDAARTALIVIDMQNFLCAEEGNPEKPSRSPIQPLARSAPGGEKGGHAGDLGELGYTS